MDFSHCSICRKYKNNTYIKHVDGTTCKLICNECYTCMKNISMIVNEDMICPFDKKIIEHKFHIPINMSHPLPPSHPTLPNPLLPQPSFPQPFPNNFPIIDTRLPEQVTPRVPKKIIDSTGTDIGLHNCYIPDKHHRYKSPPHDI